jgi:hypothetical protein
MRFSFSASALLCLLSVARGRFIRAEIPPVRPAATSNRTVSPELFVELEELARLVDITYCVGSVGLGIQHPFECPSRCGDFENFELVTVSLPKEKTPMRIFLS